MRGPRRSAGQPLGTSRPCGSLKRSNITRRAGQTTALPCRSIVAETPLPARSKGPNFAKPWVQQLRLAFGGLLAALKAGITGLRKLALEPLDPARGVNVFQLACIERVADAANIDGQFLDRASRNESAAAAASDGGRNVLGVNPFSHGGRPCWRSWFGEREDPTDGRTVYLPCPGNAPARQETQKSTPEFNRRQDAKLPKKNVLASAYDARFAGENAPRRPIKPAVDPRPTVCPGRRTRGGPPPNRATPAGS